MWVFERYTDRARRVVRMSQEEARRLNHANIDTEHILLGLTSGRDGVAGEILERFGISLPELRQRVEETVGTGPATASGGHIPFTPQAKKVLESAIGEANRLGHSYVGTEHILLGLISEGHGVAARVLIERGLDLERTRQQVVEALSTLVSEDRAEPAATAVAAVALPAMELGQFGRDLTRAAREGRLDPTVGREREIEQVLRVLTRRAKNNPILVGEPGINKVAVVEGLALAIAKDEVPESLRDSHVLALSAAPNAAAEVLRDVLATVGGRNDVILFVEELHALMAAPASSPIASIGTMLKSALDEGSLRLMGSTTLDAYRRYVANDPELGRRLQQVEVSEPSVAHTIEILKGERDRYEAHHRMSITDAAVVAAATLSDQYITDRYLPDKALDLLDEAGARTRVRRMGRPPDLRSLDGEIAQMRRDKEAAIDAQDFERAHALREEEKQLLARKAQRQREWKAADTEVVEEVDDDLIAEIVAEIAGIPADELRSLETRLRDADAVVTPPDETGGDRRYRMLNDRPVHDVAEDLLGTADIAAGIASILTASRVDSPFVVAIDGGWGAGKSTLLHQIEERLPGQPDVIKVRFNAWTADGQTTLEGLIKSVLVELDRNVVRRWARKLARRQRVVGMARLSFALFARFLGAARLVDELWTRLAVDTQSRNELRGLIQGMLSDWVQGDGTRHQGRSLVVFIDDLDRCTDEVVVGVCEAVKLYLDAPGLVFVIGCDLSALARGVASQARDNEETAHTYLEKIIQVVYRVPSPSDEQIRGLIKGYAQRAGVGALVDDTVTGILAERAGRNPRRIKRIINSFVLEQHLDPAWHRPPLGNTQLITAILLQHLYPSFYAFLVDEASGDDPIGQFLEYARVRARASDPPPREDTWWSAAGRVFRRHGLPLPDRSADAGDRLTADLERIERWLPEDFPALARNSPFVALLREIGPRNTRQALRTRLVSRPLGTASGSETA